MEVVAPSQRRIPIAQNLSIASGSRADPGTVDVTDDTKSF
jgi:hypothetical protein